MHQRYSKNNKEELNLILTAIINIIMLYLVTKKSTTCMCLV